MCVTVIIPAYNEERYIGGVLAPLCEVEEITQIIVVSDGSTDNTTGEARKKQAEVIELQVNVGKGGAMAAGLKKAKEEVILFMDADLIGLTRQHVIDMIKPVLEDQADMTLGLFEQGRLTTDMAQVIAPFLSGQRCIRKKWLDRFRGWEDAGFGVEAALTLFAQENRLRIKNVYLPALSHVMKEEKLGLLKGFAYRLKMYWEIARKVRSGV
ncbi:MAG: glycosyltransferase family 2 protein [Peptococcaceae bacterium]|jgi:glycosyltransferase involved in cell wall biosynthesis|nr:glycosyltransferase family 2 protein [Peptococcaceae bacterium]MDH7524078.1 glycosyltransferase family 2 protein [Peptococcaceae bacterium]